LINGNVVARATDLTDSPTLIAAAETPLLSVSQRVELLYVATLGRRPTSSERDRLIDFAGDGKEDCDPERLADVFWMLLNSAEFRLNH
jgi:hypothetical protein